MTARFRWALKLKHLTRLRYVEMERHTALVDRLAARSCPLCDARGLYLTAFRRPGVWNLWRGWTKRSAERAFARCGSCGFWEELVGERRIR